VIDSRSARGGFALIEILLVIAIIALLAVGYYGLSRDGENGEKKSTPARSIDKARSVECASNLRQLRALIQMHVAEHGQYPKKFNPGEHGSLGRCPVTNEPYEYDPQTGEIHCTTEGHENL
jgi:prepilin-type N-terminal cleavage/methylation domain-containing protein